MWYILAGVLGFLILNFGFYLASTLIATRIIYLKTLKRKDKEQWGREVSSQLPFMLQMDGEGMQWQAQHQDKKQDVHIVRDGLNLYGEYYDFGSDKAVMVLSGRTESLRYGYYFAQPYAHFGMNVLVVDPRAHGYSDGTFNTVGFEEGKDAFEWVKFLHETYHVKSVVLHGICIGAAGGMYAITSENCPDYFTALVTEGMFANFGHSMRNHLIERKRHWPLVMPCIDFWMKHYTGHSMMKGPIDAIGKLEKPLLMIQSRMDTYSTPENAQKLYDLCPSKEKELVWYETGGHSQLRYTDAQKYDNAILSFLDRIYNK